MPETPASWDWGESWCGHLLRVALSINKIYTLKKCPWTLKFESSNRKSEAEKSKIIAPGVSVHGFANLSYEANHFVAERYFAL